MLSVTESASAHLAQMLTDVEAPDDVAIRFVLEGRGLTMGLDKERPEDATIDHMGKTVLLLDNNISELLADKTLDVEESDEGPQLALS